MPSKRKEKKARTGGDSKGRFFGWMKKAPKAVHSTKAPSPSGKKSEMKDVGKKADTEDPLTNDSTSDNEDLLDIQFDKNGINGTKNEQNYRKNHKINGTVSEDLSSKAIKEVYEEDVKVEKQDTETKKSAKDSYKILHVDRELSDRKESRQSSERRLGKKTLKPTRSRNRRFSDSIPSNETLNHNFNYEDKTKELLLDAAYKSIPLLDFFKLPRGGISIETEAVGRVQYGIPPETIKDSLKLGIDVPTIYIVPLERFCREMGPALGINLAEFEFPAYFQFFIKNKQVQLVVDEEAEANIRRVFNETLLGPAQFRREKNPIKYEEEDFAPDFPREAIPNFVEELKHFRKTPDGKGGHFELTLEALIKFCHFSEGTERKRKLGMPPKCTEELKRRVLEANENRMNGDHLTNDHYNEGNHSYSTKILTNPTSMTSVATVYPQDATQKEIASGKMKRIEIFKEEAGTSYIIHDINEDNIIVGKLEFDGHVRVSESMGIDGFDKHKKEFVETLSASGRGRRMSLPPPTFFPPSFGVTVLGNSHGFDESGSTSGYVLWVNGRGIMIDPPPYSTATLERQGIRRCLIVGIILTHCHADHDAGAFQKVLTGSPVVVITTPTIYKSFIRKYAALSALSPALLRHSHRYKAAIIGEPLRFQGAIFYFTYTLHTIPCVAFRVEWRGRSMVFTGDHFNSPKDIDELQRNNVMSKQRADDLKNLPLQETDLLLHEAGIPPIHTPLEVLLKLPKRVKDRLYVVHTGRLPKGCELRQAPTGTSNSIRLDQKHFSSQSFEEEPVVAESLEAIPENIPSHFDEYTEYMPTNMERDRNSRSISITHFRTSMMMRPTSSRLILDERPPPLVAMRPTSSTDAWFILNLLSSVPFLSSLSYASTMEVLETAKVVTFYQDEIVIPAHRRKDVLSVVWEGTCIERIQQDVHIDEEDFYTDTENNSETGKRYRRESVWQPGDWTGPRSLQPEKRLSGESSRSEKYDVVAISSEGVKVILIEFAFLHNILREGSSLYRKYLDRKEHRRSHRRDSEASKEESVLPDLMNTEGVVNLNVMELLDCNSAFRKVSAVQKRHLESLAEGPKYFGPNQRLWKSGSPVDEAFIVVEGTAQFVTKRTNRINNGKLKWSSSHGPGNFSAPCWDPDEVDEELNEDSNNRSLPIRFSDYVENEGRRAERASSDSESTISSYESDKDLYITISEGNEDFDDKPITSSKLSDGLRKRATLAQFYNQSTTFDSDSYSVLSDDDVSDSDSNSYGPEAAGRKLLRRRSSRDQIANKKFRIGTGLTNDLIFSRGHFLGDVSKMVATRLSSAESNEEFSDDDQSGFFYGYGNVSRRVNETTIHEREDETVVHSTALAAGKDGCVVVVFPKATLIPFLDEYPGTLLSLLGTQVVI